LATPERFHAEQKEWILPSIPALVKQCRTGSAFLLNVPQPEGEVVNVLDDTKPNRLRLLAKPMPYGLRWNR
jgi:hypothetical protein